MSDWREQHATIVKQQLYMLEHKIHCDCTVTVGPEKGETKDFHAHKFVLIRASPVFEAMLLGSMSERNGQIRITDLLPDTFHSLLRYMYTDIILKSLNTDLFLYQHLTLAADKYLIPTLKEKCANILVTSVNLRSVWSTFAVANLVHHQILSEACIKIMQRDTLNCLCSDEFVTIPEDNLLFLLQLDCLQIHSELDLIKAVIRWAIQEAKRQGLSTSDSSVRKTIQPRLLSTLRFLTLKLKDFANGPALSEWLTDKEKLSIFVNIISPGKMTVNESLCANAKPRIVPQSVAARAMELQRCSTLNELLNWPNKLHLQ